MEKDEPIEAADELEARQPRAAVVLKGPEGLLAHTLARRDRRQLTPTQLVERAVRQLSGSGIGQLVRSVAAPELDTRALERGESSDLATGPEQRLRKRQRRALEKRRK